MSRMTRPQCLELLHEHSVGRIAVTDAALPAIMPVNYTMVDDMVVFRTSSSGLLARACNGTVVAFQVDELSEDGSSGRSVLVVGVADRLTGSRAARAGELGLTSAMGEGRDQYVAVTMTRVSGRRVGERPEQPLTVASEGGARCAPW